MSAKSHNISSQLVNYFRNRDNPPADLVEVVDIRQDRQDKDSYFATVRYHVDYCGPKPVHQVRVKVKMHNGKFISGWTYVR